MTSAMTAGRRGLRSEGSDEVARGRQGHRARQQHRVVERVPFQFATSLVDQVGEEAHGRSSLVAVHVVTVTATDAIASDRSSRPSSAARPTTAPSAPPPFSATRSSIEAIPPATIARTPIVTAIARACVSGPMREDTRATPVIRHRAAPAAWTASSVSRSGRSVTRRPRARIRSPSTSIPTTSRSPYRSIRRPASARSLERRGSHDHAFAPRVERGGDRAGRRRSPPPPARRTPSAAIDRRTPRRCGPRPRTRDPRRPRAGAWRPRPRQARAAATGSPSCASIRPGPPGTTGRAVRRRRRSRGSPGTPRPNPTGGRLRPAMSGRRRRRAPRRRRAASGARPSSEPVGSTRTVPTSTGVTPLEERNRTCTGALPG